MTGLAMSRLVAIFIRQHMFLSALVFAYQLVPSQAIVVATTSSAFRHALRAKRVNYSEIPPVPIKPVVPDAIAAAAEGVLAEHGGASILPAGLADRAAELAYGHIAEIIGGKAAPCAKKPAEAVGSRVGVVAATPAATPAAAGPRRGPPRPPPCAAAPRVLEKSDVMMAMAPFRPVGAVNATPQTLPAGGKAFKLTDGGWAFQYPNMAARIDGKGITRIAWPDRQFAVEMDPDGISYHSNDTVIHRDVEGDVVFHQPTGTIHKKGSTIIYHWCEPNTIVYHTPTGLIYYDNDGMTFRGRAGVAFYGRDGELLYQGVGGITKQTPEGAVTHWTASGTIYVHDDGSMAYTPVGESMSQPLAPNALGPDPFPGPPLTEEDVLKLAQDAETSAAADAALAAARLAAAKEAAHHELQEALKRKTGVAVAQPAFAPAFAPAAAPAAY